jgi:hypothetical protein
VPRVRRRREGGQLMRTDRHLRLIPGNAPHVLILERYGDTAEAVCTCGAEWSPFPIELIEALSEYHEGAVIA